MLDTTLLGDRAILALIVVLLNFAAEALGLRLPPAFEPPILLARIARALSRKLNRAHRGQTALLVRGTLAAIILVGTATVVGYALHRAAESFRQGEILEGVMLYGCLRAARPLGRLRSAARGQEQGWDLRELVAGLAVSMVNFVAAPLFWYVAIGLPALFAMAAAWALDRAAREGGGVPTPYARVPARLVRWLGGLPAGLTIVALAGAAAVTPRGRPGAALRLAWHQRSAVAGAPAAALTGGLALPHSLADQAAAPIRQNALARAGWLYAGALSILAAFLSAVAAFA